MYSFCVFSSSFSFPSHLLPSLSLSLFFSFPSFPPPLSLSPLILFRYIINKETDAISPDKRGTKVAAHYTLTVPPGGETIIKLRLCDNESLPKSDPFGVSFDEIFEDRLKEADEFYNGIIPTSFTAEQRNIARQGYAGTYLYMTCTYVSYLHVYISFTCALINIIYL